MTLSALIRKRDDLATATPAIAATQPNGEAETVAGVATVAVANLKEGKTAPTVNVGACDTATASDWWLIYYPGRKPLQVACTPATTRAEMQERHPEAVTVEPFTPVTRRPAAAMTAEEVAALRAWLVLIEEAGPANAAEVLQRCQLDTDARAYFLAQAKADLPALDSYPDDRCTCQQCANLVGRRCQAARRGEIVASRDYEPIRDISRRCEGYAPRLDDPDRRTGRERWPGLIQKEVDDGNH